ncbi:hypothetical protein VitviT2T_017301 [Vitis vinifera]|uniref:RRM domain-containing protein n=1 Tax=Vitis vinifera TaxID=29760 RepID=A0ABY9CVZ2_VITVI|nr:hypothetical protein VitviT2T_017301 [Vitis vinifera]
MHLRQVNLPSNCSLKPWNFQLIQHNCHVFLFIMIISPDDVLSPGPSPAGFHSCSRGHGISCSIRRSILEYYENERESAVASTDQIENPHEKNACEKRKSSSSRTDEQPSTKRQKDSAQNPKKVDGKGRVELENIVASNEEQELKAKDDMNKRQMKGPNYKKKQTIYEHLRDFFSDVGGVTAIRVLNDKFTGKSGGLAYVDFSDGAHLAAAVVKNNAG